MNARRKGNRLELEAQRELEAGGYLVERAYQRPKWLPGGRCINERADFFGVADLLAVRSDRVRLVQVCSDGGQSERRRKIAAIAGRFPSSWSLEVWRHRGGRAKESDRLPRGFIREQLVTAKPPCWASISMDGNYLSMVEEVNDADALILGI